MNSGEIQEFVKVTWTCIAPVETEICLGSQATQNLQELDINITVEFNENEALSRCFLMFLP